MYNKQIDAILERANDVVIRMNSKGITDLDQIPALMQGAANKSLDFIAYCEKRSRERKVSDHTKRRYKVFTDYWKTNGKNKG